ncbi:hypothetical protein FI667_g10149, partial [Globisporangium splendens]
MQEPGIRVRAHTNYSPVPSFETMSELTFLYEMMWKSAVETTENALDTLSALCMPTPLTVEMTNEPVAPVIVEAFFPIAESEVGIVEELVPAIVEDFFPIEIGADEPVAPVTTETSVPIVEPAVESAADEIAAVDADEDEEYAAIRTEFADIRSWITTYLLETETNAEIETETETEPEIESANEIAEPTTIVEVPRAAEEIVVPTKTTMTPANEETSAAPARSHAPPSASACDHRRSEPPWRFAVRVGENCNDVKGDGAFESALRPPHLLPKCRDPATMFLSLLDTALHNHSRLAAVQHSLHGKKANPKSVKKV